MPFACEEPERRRFSVVWTYPNNSWFKGRRTKTTNLLLADQIFRSGPWGKHWMFQAVPSSCKINETMFLMTRVLRWALRCINPAISFTDSALQIQGAWRPGYPTKQARDWSKVAAWVFTQKCFSVNQAKVLWCLCGVCVSQHPLMKWHCQIELSARTPKLVEGDWAGSMGVLVKGPWWRESTRSWVDHHQVLDLRLNAVVE